MDTPHNDVFRIVMRRIQPCSPCPSHTNIFPQKARKIHSVIYALLRIFRIWFSIFSHLAFSLFRSSRRRTFSSATLSFGTYSEYKNLPNILSSPLRMCLSLSWKYAPFSWTTLTRSAGTDEIPLIAPGILFHDFF